MNRRTFEILGKWIGREQRISIEFKPDICPQVNLKERRIILPSNIKEENAYAALSNLIHEAAHIRYTTQIPEKLVDDQLSHEILNVFEDVRIDNKNFGLLPNIHAFYERATDWEVIERKRKLDEMKKKDPKAEISLHRKVLINAIYNNEGLPKGVIHDAEAEKFDRQHDISNTVRQAQYDIDNKKWPEVKKKIDKLMKAFGWDKLPKIPMQGVGIGDGEGKGQGEMDCPMCNGSGKDPAQAGKGAGGKGGDKPCPMCGGTGKMPDLSDLKGTGKAWATGQGHVSGVGSSELGEVALQELTRQRFKELLNITEIRKVPEGNAVNTENLIEFFTGGIEDLFEEEITVRKKKSKIVILMDASGSMSSDLLDGTSRKAAVGGCVRELVKILNEVINLEGLNVDYEINAFDTEYHRLDKENWESQYSAHGGGTDLMDSFEIAHTDLLNDQEIDGKRIVIVFTDGDVYVDEIEDMQKRIARHGADVRAMVVGVGADVPGDLVDRIIGDNNILAKESADVILLETIMGMM